MSTRSGEFVTLREVLDEVGPCGKSSMKWVGTPPAIIF